MAEKECTAKQTGPGVTPPVATPKLVPAPPTGANLTKGSSTPDSSKVKG